MISAALYSGRSGASVTPGTVLSQQQSAARASVVRSNLGGGVTRIDPYSSPDSYALNKARQFEAQEYFLSKLEGRDQGSLLGTGDGSGLYLNREQAGSITPSETGSAYFDALVRGFLGRDAEARGSLAPAAVGTGASPDEEAAAAPAAIPSAALLAGAAVIAAMVLL
jgi:hypothetical protein